MSCTLSTSTSCTSSEEDSNLQQNNLDKRMKFTYFGPRLVPFLKTAFLYLILVPQINPPTIVVAILKCLPTFTLCIFVLWFDGFSFTSKHQYSRRVLAGFTLSMLGDALLVDEDYFIHGVASFAIAHIMYTYAFGFRPLRPLLYLKLLALGAMLYWYIYSGLTDMVLKVAVLAYICIIVLMNWRALARIRSLDDIHAGVTVKSHRKWTHLVACLGSISFCISDMFLAINRFHSPMIHERWIVMTTYYLAQLGIALSVVRNTCTETDVQRRKKLSKKVVQLQHDDTESESECIEMKLTTIPKIKEE